MKNLKINHLAVWVSVVLISALGFLWYGALFQDPWMEMVGLTKDTIDANPPGALTWIANTLATAAPLYVIAWLFTQIPIESAVKGALIASLIAFTFTMMTRIMSGVFSMDPYELAWLEGGYDCISMAIGGAIIGGWRKYAE
ncbi:MAG: DUF1761 domain-containing protein [Bacteroidota bacterium]